MTVKDLKKAIENLPDDLEVFIDDSEYGFGLVCNAHKFEMTMYGDGREKTKKTVLVLSNEL